MSLQGLLNYGTPETESPDSTPSPRVTTPRIVEKEKKTVPIFVSKEVEINVGKSKNNTKDTKDVKSSTEISVNVMHDILKKLPDEPEGGIDEELQVTIKREIERKNKSGIPFTLRLQKRKDFGNPYHLSLIVDLKNIDEWGSNYPKGKFDPHCDAEYFVNKLSFAPTPMSRSLSNSGRSNRVSRTSRGSRPLLKRSSSSTEATITNTTATKTGKKRKLYQPVGAGISSAQAVNDMKAMIAKTVAKKIEENLLKKKKST